jgi:hypothetical protein
LRLALLGAPQDSSASWVSIMPRMARISFIIAATSGCGSTSFSTAGSANDAMSALARASTSTLPLTVRLDRITASAPNASRTMRSASRDVWAENFLTFIAAPVGRGFTLMVNY